MVSRFPLAYMETGTVEPPVPYRVSPHTSKSWSRALHPGLSHGEPLQFPTCHVTAFTNYKTFQVSDSYRFRDLRDLELILLTEDCFSRVHLHRESHFSMDIPFQVPGMGPGRAVLDSMSRVPLTSHAYTVPYLPRMRRVL